jgi:hypothetical protein
VRLGMNIDPWLDDPDLARTVVREGLGVLAASDVVAGRIGELSLLSGEEYEEMSAFGARIDAYCHLTNPEHPLCLGVFGPPGSGKSFAVKQLIKTKGLTARTLNLSQFQGPNDLSAALAEVARWTPGETPVVFFDEFDSRLGGAPLGWLQWLLAPMQDGVAFDHGHRVELKRAVFVFAGGTADTFEEFPAAHERYYRAAKGPDFVSRLRGYINIRGVNDGPYRRVRRAIVLRLTIEQVAPGLFDDQDRAPAERMTDGFIDQLLAVGRYRHGARSVEALVEMSTKPEQQQFSAEDLPSADVLASHVDLGPLGELVIALSAGGEPGRAGAGGGSTSLAQVWPKVATRLLEIGAGLIYGGDLSEGGGIFTQQLIQANSRLPNLLVPEEVQDDAPLARPRPGRVTWVQAGAGSPPPVPALPDRVAYRWLGNLSPEELEEIRLPPEADLSAFDRAAEPPENWRDSSDWCTRLGFSLALFRMRALVTRLADAHLVFGGREHGSLGRFPGIAEEVMLSLASGTPVYVCGGFGGAARAVGQALGLGEAWAVTPACLQREAHAPGASVFEAATKEWGDRFQLPDRGDLPLSYSELREFLRSHALGSPGWPDNGLTAEENRALFRSNEEHKIVALVEKGLLRRFLLK